METTVKKKQTKPSSESEQEQGKYTMNAELLHDLAAKAEEEDKQGLCVTDEEFSKATAQW